MRRMRGRDVGTDRQAGELEAANAAKLSLEERKGREKKKKKKRKE